MHNQAVYLRLTTMQTIMEALRWRHVGQVAYCAQRVQLTLCLVIKLRPPHGHELIRVSVDAAEDLRKLDKLAGSRCPSTQLRLCFAPARP